MNRKIIITADGSKTIQLEDWNEQYHSIHGAVQEAYHVFIKHGLQQFENQNVSILEIGFGTGLNALITMVEAQKLSLRVNYCGVEAFPVSMEEINQLDYVRTLNFEAHENEFLNMHISDWGKEQKINPNFTLQKHQLDFREVSYQNLFNLIYFDAFGHRVQPELWSESIFKKMYGALKLGGVLVTYSAKGSVRRAMQEVGFTVERLPGPPGKREMLRATK
ncbi:tRNA (5-methylaminomethyl-2-thiouridine)(34)-methyltransferase MnmD [Croceitalea sp. MTPC9]|uniref:tRNA (5-methylaminomethyl-2-thiouridine)(34)-methyltransferase MnmD n=1 Tax=unclassified Croceitalea TaxID=2632280 RepID=UPI002B3E3358|nr:tRNA (5-methylaminomethyl-2-thiouridine)(34)-methyltransferase MnmD [Croceitalea sp. MTPC6]GMN15083.1 tRNA (5-methylaminomethyl-2-thiouridine)(34)-methyltransferase MnmD [Croceitalea sp. MTPC9]